jgi:hypothetical protein
MWLLDIEVGMDRGIQVKSCPFRPDVVRHEEFRSAVAKSL